jgi:hypothetical protein
MKKTLIAALAVLTLASVATPKPAHALIGFATGSADLATVGFVLGFAGTTTFCVENGYNPFAGCIISGGEKMDGLWIAAAGTLILDSQGNPTADLTLPTPDQARAIGLTSEELSSLGNDLLGVNAINESETAQADVMLAHGATQAEIKKFMNDAWKSDSAALASATVSAIAKIASQSK